MSLIEQIAKSNGARKFLNRYLPMVLSAVLIAGAVFAYLIYKDSHIAQAAPAYVNGCHAYISSNSITCTITGATANNVVAAYVAWISTSNTLSSVSICGTSATLYDNPTTQGANTRAAWAVAVVGSSGDCAVTASLSGSQQTLVVSHEISGVDTSTPVDQHLINAQGFSGGGTDACASGNVTTNYDGEYIMGVCSDAGNSADFTAGTGFNQRLVENSIGFNATSEDKIQTSAGAVQITESHTIAANIQAGIMTFKPASAAVASSYINIRGGGPIQAVNIRGGGSGGSFSHAQAGVAGTAASGTTVVCTLGSNPSTGDLVTVNVLFYDGGTTPPTMTVQDGNSNSYAVSATDSGSTNMDTAGWAGQAYLLTAPANANKTITVTFNRTISAAAIWCDDFTVSGGTAQVDDSGKFASGSGTGVTAPTLTVTGTSDLLTAMTTHSNTINTFDSPWVGNDGGSQFGNWAGYALNISSDQTVNFTDTNDSWNALGMSFKVVIPSVKFR